MRFFLQGLLLVLAVGFTSAEVPVAQTFSNPATTDQDDMCIWLHPADPSMSTVIASDAKADSVFVYGLDGILLQTISTPRSGNIDVRYDIQLGGECVDLVAFNEKNDETIHVYRVDPLTRTLERVDDGAIDTGPNYGMTLYRHEDGSLFVVTGPKGTPYLLKQYELVDDGTGQISGAATGWEFLETTVEGMVGDDETGYLYLAEQDIGIWRFGLRRRSRRLAAPALEPGRFHADHARVHDQRHRGDHVALFRRPAGGHGLLVPGTRRSRLR